MGLDTWATIFSSVGQGLLGAQEIKDKIRRDLAEETERKRREILFNRGTEEYERMVANRPAEEDLTREGKQSILEDREARRKAAEYDAQIKDWAGAVMEAFAGSGDRNMVQAAQKNPQVLKDLGIPRAAWSTVLSEVGKNDLPASQLYPKPPAPSTYKPELYNKINENIGDIEAASGRLEETKSKLSQPGYVTESGKYDPSGTSTHSEPNFRLSPAQEAMAHVELRKTGEFNRVLGMYKSHIKRLEGNLELAKMSGDAFSQKAAQNALDSFVNRVVKPAIEKAAGLSSLPNEEKNKPKSWLVEMGW